MPSNQALEVITDANRLQELIDQRGIKITWLAEKSGGGRNTIHNYLRGGVPALDKAYAIAKVLGLTEYDIWPPDE